MRKRILSFVLTLAMVLAMLPVSVFADNSAALTGTVFIEIKPSQTGLWCIDKNATVIIASGNTAMRSNLSGVDISSYKKTVNGNNYLVISNADNLKWTVGTATYGDGKTGNTFKNNSNQYLTLKRKLSSIYWKTYLGLGSSEVEYWYDRSGVLVENAEDSYSSVWQPDYNGGTNALYSRIHIKKFWASRTLFYNNTFMVREGSSSGSDKDGDYKYGLTIYQQVDSTVTVTDNTVDSTGSVVLPNVDVSALKDGFTVKYKGTDGNWYTKETAESKTNLFPVTAGDYSVVVGLFFGDNTQPMSSVSANVKITHTHSYSTEWSNDSTNHWHAATCDHTTEKADVAAHTWDETTGGCSVCGYLKSFAVTATVETAGTGTVSVSDAVYSNKNLDELHKGDLVKITTTPADGYNLKNLVVKTENGPVAMVDSDSFYMPAADVTVTATFAQGAVYHPAVAATCGADGNKAYWTTSDGKYYLDADCNEETTAAGVIISATGNHHNDTLEFWSWINKGDHWIAHYATTCSVCGKNSLENGDANLTKSEPVNGKVTYTASVVVNGQIYETTKTVEEKYAVTLNGESAGDYSFGDVATLTLEDTAWDWYVNGTKVKANSKQYAFIVTANTTVTTQEVTATAPILAFTTSGRTTPDSKGKTKIDFNVTWSLPEGYTLVSVGLKRAYDVGESPAIGKLTTTNASSLKKRNGIYELTVNMSAPTSQKSITAVGYMTYKDNTGAVKTIYSAPIFVAGVN